MIPKLKIIQNYSSMEDKLQEELFFIYLYLNGENNDTEEVRKVIKRKKEIEEQLKLLELQKDF